MEKNQNIKICLEIVQLVLIHESKENDQAGLNVQMLLFIIWPTFRKFNYIKL